MPDEGDLRRQQPLTLSGFKDRLALWTTANFPTRARSELQLQGMLRDAPLARRGREGAARGRESLFRSDGDLIAVLEAFANGPEAIGGWWWVVGCAVACGALRARENTFKTHRRSLRRAPL